MKPFGTTRLVCAAALTLALTVGCAANDEPGVEVFENGAYHARVVRAYEISGARDGATTRVTGVFTLDYGDRIRVELEISYNPTPVLASGRWTREGDTTEQGEAREESLKFLGGQGAKPSVGGRFRLESNGAPRFRVTMPTRPVG
jgi:hypothetical protein